METSASFEARSAPLPYPTVRTTANPNPAISGLTSICTKIESEPIAWQLQLQILWRLTQVDAERAIQKQKAPPVAGVLFRSCLAVRACPQMLVRGSYGKLSPD